MGDIADWLMEQDWDDEFADGEPFTPRPPRCKHCGSRDVRWRQQSGRWVLFSLQPGVVHRCEVSPDEFPTI